VELINWLWLEDLLVRASEAEIRCFGAAHPGEAFFAFCLEFDGLQGTLGLSYGTREAVEYVVAGRRSDEGEETVCYRAVELLPENWRYRKRPVQDPEGAWQQAQPILQRYRDAMAADLDPGVTEFLWMRFEFLAECVVQRLTERGAFRHLAQEGEFLAYTGNENESLEELEDRLEKLYPHYRRATAELVSQPRMGQPLPKACANADRSPHGSRGSLYRCTHCGDWYCASCADGHFHEELSVRLPFFFAGSQ